MDRSLAFTALLEVPEYGRLSVEESLPIITDFLTDWYKSPSKNMVAYAKTWMANYLNS